MKIKNIVFDFDGVIADTFDLSWTLSKQCDPKISLQDFKDHHNGNVLEEPKIDFNASDKNVGYFFKNYIEKISKKNLRGREKFLKNLYNIGYRLYIVSSNTERAIKKVLLESHILDLFEYIGGYETEKSKIKKFKFLEKNFDLNIGNTVFITDTLGDILEISKLNYNIIGVTFGFHNEDDLKKSNPYKILNSWDEIYREFS